MSQHKPGEISESTIARIAGNLLAGRVIEVDGSIQRQAARFAVAQARAIAAEVKRTADAEAR